jgi:hypothetical protein
MPISSQPTTVSPSVAPLALPTAAPSEYPTYLPTEASQQLDGSQLMALTTML